MRGEGYLALLSDVEMIDAAASQPGCGHPISPIAADIIVHQHRLKPVSTLRQSMYTSHTTMMAGLSLYQVQGHGQKKHQQV